MSAFRHGSSIMFGSKNRGKVKLMCATKSTRAVNNNGAFLLNARESQFFLDFRISSNAPTTCMCMKCAISVLFGQYESKV